MKKILLIIMILLSTNFAYAAFSLFVRITPENEQEYNVKVLVEPLKEQQDQLKITMNPQHSTWLITCAEALSAENQNFRDYIWYGREEGKKIIEKSQVDSDDEKIEIVLSRDVIKRSYIYHDFSQPVHDGGIYYTIDLNAYLE